MSITKHGKNITLANGFQTEKAEIVSATVNRYVLNPRPPFTIVSGSSTAPSIHAPQSYDVPVVLPHNDPADPPPHYHTSRSAIHDAVPVVIPSDVSGDADVR
jgi:hypothetical protein